MARAGWVWIAGLLATAACDSLLGFGDERELSDATAGSGGQAGASASGGEAGAAGGDGGSFGGVSGGAAGSGGSASGIGGSASAAGVAGSAGSAGSAGAAGSSGSAGSAGSAGMGGSAGSAGGLLWFQDAEASSYETNGTDCGAEQPALTVPASVPQSAACDWSVGALGGAQSIRVFSAQGLACIGCWSAPSELWVEFLMRPGGWHQLYTLVFQPVSGGEPLMQSRAGAGVRITSTGELTLRCPGSTQDAQLTTLSLSNAYSVTYRYVPVSGLTELWLRSAAGAAPVGVRGLPVATATCAVKPGATGFYAQGFTDTDIRGSVLIDDIRVAGSVGALDGSY